MSSAFARLILPDGQEYKLPVLKGTQGPDVLDIQKLYAETGYFTYDPGFTSTASCESSITYIDGEAGVLAHRGYCIEELAEKHTYLEFVYLLMYGRLPTSPELNAFEAEVDQHSMLHE